MPTMKLAFGEWLPDKPSVTLSLQEATNVVPTLSGYSNFPSAVAYSNAADTSIIAVGAGKFSNTTQLFAGSSTKLYKFNASTLNLDDVSKSGGYNTSSWNFVQFGESFIAANNSNKLQAWTVGTSTAFADLSASAPTAKFVTVIRDFVVAANLDGEASPNKVQWSDIADETNWTSGAASQSDFQIIADGGDITGITGGEFGIVFLERSIVRMSYIGSPYFFQFDVISRNLGCKYSGSVAQYGQMSFFLADDGFYSCDGTTLTSIGNEKVDRYFYDNVDLSGISTITSAIDPIRKLVIWNYPNQNNSRSMIVYNWQIGRWSLVDDAVDYIYSAATSGYTLESLDAFGTLDSLTTSLDSPLWAGGSYLFAGIQNNKIVTFTGASLTATIVTGDIEQGYNSVVTLARPQIDNGSCTVSIASRKELDDTITFSTPVTTSQEGRAPLRSYGRYHRFKITPTGSWTTAISLDADLKPQGSR